MHRTALALAFLLGAAPAFAEAPPEAVLRKEAGNHYMKLREYPQARDQYLAALKIDPAYEDAHYNLGVVYFFRLSDYRRALYHFTRYVTLKPDAPDLAQVKGLTLQALEKIEGLEREAYAPALAKGTREALDQFLTAHPLGPYADDAREKQKALAQHSAALEAYRRGVDTEYQEALQRGTPEALDAFQQRYPGTPSAEEARKVRDAWVAERSEDAKALGMARAAGTPEEYERFLAERPKSRLAPEAKVELARSRAADQAFRIARDARSVPALEVFLTTYAGTRQEAEARALLADLKKAAASAKTEVERQAREAKDAKAREEAAAKTRAAAEKKAQEDAAAAAKAKAEADRLAKEAAEGKTREEAAAKTRAAAEKKAQEDAAVAAKVEADRLAKEAAEAKTRAAAEKKAQEDAAVAAKVEADRLARPEVRRALAWQTAQQEDTVEAYEHFLATYPEGEEAKAAQARLQELAPPETEEGLDSLSRDKRKALERYRQKIQTSK